MGIDGRLFPVSAVEHRRKATVDELQLEERWYPFRRRRRLQRRSSEAGLQTPPPISFEAMVMREECQKGFFISFYYSSDAMSEISRFFKQPGKVIIPLTVQEILDEQIAHKLA